MKRSARDGRRAEALPGERMPGQEEALRNLIEIAIIVYAYVFI